ncbi:igLON family member 5-like isoform X2 [Ptychodera flava]|uniref:igLON family member 5-like isoform X2 n=1 Tax=Ptychodera flava TaxID=63121 RepID=UPI00396A9D32
MRLSVGFVLLQWAVLAYCQEPAIIPGPYNVTEVIGSNARLQCRVQNLGIYRVSWVRVESAEILTIGADPYSPGQTRYQIVDEESWELEITDIGEDDRGEYQCQINTTPRKTYTVFLEVAVPARISAIEPIMVRHLDADDMKKRIFNESDNAILSCVTSGRPKPTVTWIRHDGELPGGGSSKETDTLYFDDVQEDSAGTYECTASNGYGNMDSQEIELVVQYKPKISGPVNDLRFGAGSSVKLRCIANANPDATFAWFKGNVTLANFVVQDRVSEYNIDRLEPERDYGDYKCIATNVLGSSVQRYTISGNPKSPTITSHPRSDKRTAYTLEWRAPHQGGGPILQYAMKYRRFSEESTVNGTEVVFGDWVDDTYTPSFGHSSFEKTLTNLEGDSKFKLRLWAVNEYGNGDVAKFEFETSKVDRVTPTVKPVVTTAAKPEKKTTEEKKKNPSTKSYHKPVTHQVKDGASPRACLSFAAMATVILIQLFL